MYKAHGTIEMWKKFNVSFITWISGTSVKKDKVFSINLGIRRGV